MVYLIKCGEFYKIGYTSGRDVAPRLRDLQTANPLPLTLVDVWAGSQEVEAELHERFAEQRVRGEWFSLSHADLMWIAGIAHIARAMYGYPDFPGQPYSVAP